MSISIYHNPRCSKSRTTLGLLEEKGITPEIVTYLDTPPTESELTDILGKLGKKPTDLIRFGESIAKELGLSQNDDRSDAEWVQLMVRNPILIERPIVVNGDKAAVGRPPESVLDIL